MRSKKFVMGMTALIFILLLSACASNQKSTPDKTAKHTSMNMNMSDMHSGSSEIPAGLKEAKNPTYKVGSQVIVKGDHMEGMNGASATIVGAYDTTVYAVTYTPTTGGAIVKNHKWVIQEEIKDAGSKPLKPGTKVTLEAEHMDGMMGATGTIDSAEHITVYMIDYTPTTGGAKVKNHKWVTESELTAK
ncbi:YdhK family protein [Bacillus sp. BRMEA1]|uniref:YdhK family protein n=1 Tax=Neobacillus endophyticus TaxID=2738405 RepID=UPI001565A751|nr:YdhK family protein [Neobacillus endophyticus]NRD76993.1 YdhK family protein [Neobacillus endophyticus]